MKASVEVKDNIIIRSFNGDVYLEDIIDSWDEILSMFDDLSAYKGILTDLLDAKMHHKEKNVKILSEYLNGHQERIRDMRVAIVMDTPHVSNAMMIDQKVKRINIKPFTTLKAAIDWISV